MDDGGGRFDPQNLPHGGKIYGLRGGMAILLRVVYPMAVRGHWDGPIDNRPQVLQPAPHAL